MLKSEIIALQQERSSWPYWLVSSIVQNAVALNSCWEQERCEMWLSSEAQVPKCPC